MKRMDSRIKNIEDKLKPQQKPQFLVMRDHRGQREKILECRKAHPGSPMPTILIIKTSTKPANSGTGRQTDMDEKRLNSLSTRQSRVITVLVQARNIEDGAKRAGISKTTIYKWLRQPPFP